MSSSSDPVMLNVFMSPPYSPSSPDCSPMDTTSTMAPGMLDRHFPMTPFPCFNSSMPAEWTDSDQLSQGIDAYDFACYLELLSPLAMFLHGDSQKCEVSEWEPPPDASFIAVGGTSGPENAPVTTKLSILTNPDGSIDRKVVEDSTQQDPS
ncbi:hypothetical protein J7T55_015733, partial [Diaporthe amygdali]|uniref:uncharacterized protein n=1 Tax=Phomopsis amygdali TaxID=1214568 RepID=UPI0022FEDCB8